MSFSTLSVTNDSGTRSFTVGNTSRLVITSAWQVPGERCLCRFRGFRQYGPASDAWDPPNSLSYYVDPVRRVSALSFDADTGEITVTEAGGEAIKGPWTQTTTIPIDAGSELRIYGARVSNADAGLVNAVVPLNGLSALSVTEAGWT